MAGTTFEDPGFPQGKYRPLYCGSLPDIAGVIELHRKPGQVAFRPDFEIGNRDFNLLRVDEFFTHFPFEFRPADVFATPHRVTDDIGIVSHKTRQRRKIFFRIGPDHLTNGCFRV